jgi:hypothetical protein
MTDLNPYPIYIAGILLIAAGAALNFAKNKYSENQSRNRRKI